MSNYFDRHWISGTAKLRDVLIGNIFSGVFQSFCAHEELVSLVQFPSEKGMSMGMDNGIRRASGRYTSVHDVRKLQTLCVVSH